MGYLFWIIVGLCTTASIGLHPSEASSRPHQRLFKIFSPHKHKTVKILRPGPLGPHLHYHDIEHDSHYEYIRPHKPPPIPPFYNNVKYSSFSSGRHPPSNYIVKSPNFAIPHKSSSYIPPIIKESFRSSPPIPPSFNHISSSHIINSDDDNGPIREIPAPDLSPKSVHHPFHHHFDHDPPPPLDKQPHFIEAELIKEKPTFEIVKESFEKKPFEIFEKKPTYEVTETLITNDKVVETPDGSKVLYAPDPDPGLPTHKIHPETNPHSIPSETAALPTLDSRFPAASLNNFPTAQEYQILEGGTLSAAIPNLSSQELFDLMNSFPRDEYTIIQGSPHHQPVLATLGNQNYKTYVQATPESHRDLEENALPHAEFNQQQYQSFDYQENHPSEYYQTHYDHEASESENKEHQNVIRQTMEGNPKTESVKKVLPSDISNMIPDEDGKDQKSMLEIPLFSTLPSKETAEAFATLQSAGDVTNKLRGDQKPDEELPVRPKEVHTEDTEEESPVQAENKDQHKEVLIEKSVPLYEASYISKSLDSSDDLEIGQGAESERFGKRMKPK